jgi:flavin-dependent dehydrogenase
MNNNAGLPESCSVAIVGGGTAGLALAAELRRQGIDNVVVLEREKDAGGIPRHCGHYPFGIMEYGKLLKGPPPQWEIEPFNTFWSGPIAG